VRTLLVVLALLALPTSAHAADPFTVTAPDGAVYRATASELAHWTDVAKRSGATRTAVAREQAFQLLVSFAWLRGEAAERGIAVTWDQVVREFRRQRADSFPTRRDYRRFLREYGQTTDDILVRVHIDMLSDRIRDQVLAPVTVTDGDVDAYLAEHGKPRVPERRDIRLVLTRERSAAVAAKRELLRGATWSAVARRYSIDAATRRNKARLPNVARSWLERRLGRAVFGARPGRIVGPVRTRSGYYIVRVTRVHPAHDVADDVAREDVRQVLLSKGQQAALDSFVAEFEAKWRARTVCAPRWRAQRQCGG
jgi:foldase protein PrsA